MTAVRDFVRARIDALGKQQKVVAAEFTEQLQKHSGEEVKPTTVESKLSKLLGETSWGEGHRFFLDEETRRGALCAALDAPPSELHRATEVARGEVILLLDPALPPAAIAYFVAAVERGEGRFRVEKAPAADPAQNIRPAVALRDAARALGSPVLVLASDTARAHAEFLSGAELKQVQAIDVVGGWLLSEPLGELVPLPPPPPPKLRDEDGHPMIADAELARLLEQDPGAFERARYSGAPPAWVQKARDELRKASSERRTQTIRLEYVANYRLQAALAAKSAWYVKDWGKNSYREEDGRTFATRPVREQLDAREYQIEHLDSKEVLDRVRSNEDIALYWRHDGRLCRLGHASNDLGLPSEFAPRLAEPVVAALAELPSFNFNDPRDPGVVQLRQVAHRLTADWGVPVDEYLAAWTNNRARQDWLPPYRCAPSEQQDLVIAARRELEDVSERDALLDHRGFDAVDVLRRAARSPLQVLSSSNGLRIIRADLSGGRIALIELRRYSRTEAGPLRELPEKLCPPGAWMLDGGDVEIRLSIRSIYALEGPFLAARASRERTEEEERRTRHDDD